jgi:uncharacterized protein
MNVEPLTIPSAGGDLSAELTLPPDPRALLVLAHGAGAGFRHANLLAISRALATEAIASLRFNFPFIELGRRRVDAQPVAVASIAQAVARGAERLPNMPLYVGGHSFGGRMASHAVAEHAVAATGLVCMNFPLHPAGRPGSARAAHFGAIDLPALFLSGTRDDLADPVLLNQAVTQLHERDPRTRLHWLEDADHGYRVRRGKRRDSRSVFEEMAREIAVFIAAT